MSSDFSMSVVQQEKCLQIQIRGSLDGSAVQQLLYTLCQYVDLFPLIVINTDGVFHVEAFGLNLLRYNLEIMKRSTEQFKFTGNHAPVFQSLINRII